MKKQCNNFEKSLGKKTKGKKRHTKIFTLHYILMTYKFALQYFYCILYFYQHCINYVHLMYFNRTLYFLCSYIIFIIIYNMYENVTSAIFLKLHFGVNMLTQIEASRHLRF
jgi:hypothetical protein